MLIVFWDVSVLQYNIRIVLLFIRPSSRRQKEKGRTCDGGMDPHASMPTSQYNWPKGLFFKILLVWVPCRALYHFTTMVVWVCFCVREDFFNPFINAESMVSAFNNTIEVKVYIYECIFWGCSVDTFWEDNLAIFYNKIYAKLRKYWGCIKGVRHVTHSPPPGFEIFPTLLYASVIITVKLALI
jgi:hypothetical protein